MTEMRVSAVITAYNSEPFLEEAIDSVLKQSKPMDEIIVVDDGSTDRTRQIAERFDGRGVRYIYQTNQGAGAARNRGVRETNGDLIAFLDADDTWLEGKTRLQFDYLTMHPDVALVSGFRYWWHIPRNECWLSGEFSKSMAELRREILVRNMIGNPSAVMLRRSEILAVGLFDENIRWGQDWDLWIRMTRRANAAVIPEPLIVYRWHESNLSHTLRWERLYSYWNVSSRAIRASQPSWMRPWLSARSWSEFTRRRAEHVIENKYPRWQQMRYAAAAVLAYPFENISEKIQILVRALIGDELYQSGKRWFRLRQARGQ